MDRLGTPKLDTPVCHDVLLSHDISIHLKGKDSG